MVFDLVQEGLRLSSLYFNLGVSQLSENPDIDESYLIGRFESNEFDEESEEDVTQRGELVRILIDKTNLGIPPVFSQVEKDKILMAEQVDIIEVETLSIPSTKMKKVERSFLERLASTVVLVFRFHATISGLTYGEMRISP